MLPLIKRFFTEQSGATAIEYGLIAALIAIVMIAAVTQLGQSLMGRFQLVADNLT